MPRIIQDSLFWFPVGSDCTSNPLRWNFLFIPSAAPTEASWHCQSGKEWQGTKLHFQLIPGDKTTLVKFTHAGWQSETDYFVACNTTWGELMFRLKSVAEGKAPGPLFSADGMAY